MKKNAKYFNLLAALLAFVAIIMIFLPAVAGDNAESTYNGLKLVFGLKEKVFSTEVTVFGFSFMNLLTYILALVVVVLSALLYVKEDKFVSLAVVLFALVSGVFFLLVKNFAVLGDSAKALYDLADTTFAKENNYGVGSIIGAVLMFLSAVVMGAKVFLSSK